MKKTKILVWDLPLRVFHWLLAASFAGAFLTAEAERYRGIHVALGYTILALLAFRLLWAFTGTRYARISSFAFGPRAVVGYLRSLLSRSPVHYVGHNPAGSWMIYAFLLLGIAVGVSGYAFHADLAGHWLKELHEGLANAMLGLVIVHILGVVISSVLHRENLPLAMVTGYKRGSPEAAIRHTRWATALAVVLAVGMLWSVIPTVQLTAGQREAVAHGQSHSSAQREGRRHARHENHES